MSEHWADWMIMRR